MPLPVDIYELFLESEDDTDVIGDIDAFMVYVQSGGAARDWESRLAWRLQQLEELIGSEISLDG
jgi:hypothetical protein